MDKSLTKVRDTPLERLSSTDRAVANFYTRINGYLIVEGTQASLRKRSCCFSACTST